MRSIQALVNLSLEVVSLLSLKMFLQRISDFVSVMILPSFFSYMITYVELLVRYAGLSKTGDCGNFLRI